MEIDGSLRTFAFRLCFLETQKTGAGNQGGKALETGGDAGGRKGVSGADVVPAASPVDPGSQQNPDGELSCWK